MSAVDVRIQVKEFKEKHAYGEEPADCFAPWYLSTVFGLSPTEAIRRSAESKQGLNGPGFDFNIDAFHVIQEDSKAHTLILMPL